MLAVVDSLVPDGLWGLFRNTARMSTPEAQLPPTTARPATTDRIFRSPVGIATGAVLLVVFLWLGISTVVSAERRHALESAGRDAAGHSPVDRLHHAAGSLRRRPPVALRNPFRTITLPWGTVSGLRAGHSNEVFGQTGAKYQLWAVPVSVRGVRQAGYEQMRWWSPRWLRVASPLTAEGCSTRDGPMRQARRRNAYGRGPAEPPTVCVPSRRQAPRPRRVRPARGALGIRNHRPGGRRVGTADRAARRGLGLVRAVKFATRDQGCCCGGAEEDVPALVVAGGDRPGLFRRLIARSTVLRFL